jgi:hypothetical protein
VRWSSRNASRRTAGEGPPTVVEVNEFFERCVPVARLDVPTPSITQVPQRDERRPIVGLEQASGSITAKEASAVGVVAATCSVVARPHENPTR